MKFLSFDLALAETGWALLTDGALDSYGVISTHPQASDWERIVELRGKVASTINQAHLAAGRDGPDLVAFEVTDWMPGKRDDRDAWVREARARYALGMALAAAVCACEDLVIEPVLVGANAWHREFGAVQKASIAEFVAAEFPHAFRVVTVQGLRKGKPFCEHVVFERETNKRVPSHVTDACGLGLVVYRRWLQEQRIQEAEKAR
jgi:hypothetical protein